MRPGTVRALDLLRWLATAAVVMIGAVYAERSWGQEQDTTPPDTRITSAPRSSTNLTYAYFYFSATETGSTFQCRLDAQSYAPCVSPAYYSGLSAGTHVFYVKATDLAGNTDSTAAYRYWKVDLTAPNTTIKAAPPNPTNQTSAAFSFSSTEASTFGCRLDSASFFTACYSPKTYSGLAAGTHTFEVRATDYAGNQDTTPALFTWTVDLTPPDTSLSASVNSSPLNSGETTSSTSITFTFGSTEPYAFYCQLDVGTPAGCVSPLAVTVNQGVHTFSVYAVDRAGNPDPTPAGFTWTVDVPPTVRLVSTPPYWSNSATATFEFAASEEGCTFRCAVDSDPFVACASPFTTPALAEGTHFFYVNATDSGGTMSPTMYNWWTVDTISPDTTISPEPPAITGRNATFAFVSSESGVSFDCSLDGGEFWHCSSPTTYYFATSGAHGFSVRARDRAGNVDLTPASHSWTVDAEPPTFEGAMGAGAVSSTRVEVTWPPASDNISSTDRISYQVCEATFSGGCLSNFVATVTTDLGATSASVTGLSASTIYYLVVRAVDEAGNKEWNVKEVSAQTQAAPGTLLMKIEGDRPSGRLGMAGTMLGDIDGDNRAEFALGEPGLMGGSGRVLVYSWMDPAGAPSNAKLQHVIWNPGYTMSFGDVVQGGGDINADGVPDLLATGMYGADGRNFVYAFSGRDGSLLFQIESQGTNDGFGSSTAIVGDLNGDGHAEILVGAPSASAEFGRAGLAYLYSGADATLLRAPCNMAYTETEFGAAVAAIGDVDGDGTGDYAIGAPRDYADPLMLHQTGVVYVFSGAQGNLLHIKAGSKDSGRFGQSISGGYDLNGDGSADWAAAWSYWDGSGIHVFSGRDGTALWEKNNVAMPISMSPDLNGDGSADLLAGTTAWSGSNGDWLFMMPAPGPFTVTMPPGDGFGRFVSPAGDVNGDGYADVLIGAPDTTVESILGTLDFAGTAYVFTGGRQ